MFQSHLLLLRHLQLLAQLVEVRLQVRDLLLGLQVRQRFAFVFLFEPIERCINVLLHGNNERTTGELSCRRRVKPEKMSLTFSCVLRSSSCSLRVSKLTRSQFSFSKSSALVLAASSSCSVANLPDQKEIARQCNTPRSSALSPKEKK